MLTWTEPSNAEQFFFRSKKENVSEINGDLFLVFRITAANSPQNST
jgi:hypothetical protein